MRRRRAGSRGADAPHLAGRRVPRSRALPPATGSVPTIVDLAPPPAGTSARRTTSTASASTGTSRCGRSSTTRSTLEQFATPVHGHDPYQVAVGPIHAGVIESGHFRFHVVGDLILHVDARLFYKHRGLERAAEGLPLEDALQVVARSCAGCWVSNAVAYAQACEETLGLEPTSELARARTILLELERVWNTLNDIGAICAGVGVAAGTSRFAALVDDARRLNERLTGHRFLFGSVAVGGSALDLDDRRCAKPGRLSPGSARSRHGPGRRCSSTARSWIGCPTSGSSMPRRRSRSASSARPHARRALPRT